MLSVRLVLALLLAGAAGCAVPELQGAGKDAASRATSNAASTTAQARGERIQPVILAPYAGIGRTNLGVIVNARDPLSVEIGNYYQMRRDIPPANLIKVAFDPGTAVMSRAEFERIKAEVDHQAGPEIQAFALTWRLPYRVDCMSITSAFAFGFDPEHCASGCKPTKVSPYYNANVNAPFTQLGIRPTMSLAAVSAEKARELIDRGVAADGSYPEGTAYLLETSDKARSVRITNVSNQPIAVLSPRLKLAPLKTDAIRFKDDVMFYFTGLANVPNLENNHYLPGAMADHLTSAGGVLAEGSSQMTALKWLYYGATGSYGAVVEPCNFVTKFPAPAVAITRYASGETLLEAYWKSVAMPGQGIFIGEPLARPYGGYKVRVADNGKVVSVFSHRLVDGRYTVQGSDSPLGPYRTVVEDVSVAGRAFEIRFVAEVLNRFYRVQPSRN
ncbi:MAG: TIGR03790 family protein [Thiotrichales bacterium]